MKNTVLRIMSLFFLIFIMGCNIYEDEGTNYDNKFEEIFGKKVIKDFMGEVVDENNNPLQNVSIEIGNKYVQTDLNGVFIIKNATVFENFAYIKANKIGYIDGSRSIVPTNGMNQIKIMLLTNTPIATINSGQTSQVDLQNGTSVKFDGYFKNENGDSYTGIINVFAYHLETSNENLMDIMPGMLLALDQNGTKQVLETFGMLHVDLMGDNGQKIQIADGHSAEISMKIDESQLNNASSSIPLWHFDEINGFWKQEGEAIRQGNHYVGNVSHFSWWNCDQFFDSAFLHLSIKDNNNKPLSYTFVSIQRSDNTLSMSSLTNKNGEIAGLVPANENLNAVIIDPCENLIYIPIGTLSSKSTNHLELVCSAYGSANQVTVKGHLQDCNNSNVTNGYVMLEYGNNHKRLIETDSNGSFNINSAYCLPNLNFFLTGFNFDTLQETDKINYSYAINSPLVNVGNLITCNTVTEFISYQIDNEPIVYYLSNINAFYYPITNKIAIQGNSTSTQSPIFMSLSNQIGIQNYFFIGGQMGELGSSSSFITFTLNHFGAVGDYIDINFSGNYIDSFGELRYISGVAHVIRDF